MKKAEKHNFNEFWQPYTGVVDMEDLWNLSPKGPSTSRGSTLSSTCLAGVWTQGVAKNGFGNLMSPGRVLSEVWLYIDDISKNIR